MTNKEKKVIKLGYIIYYISVLIAFIYCFKTSNTNGFNMGFVAIFTPIMAPIALKIIGFKSIYEIYIINIIFAFIASILGSMLGAYQIPLFDKLLHFSSGILFTQLAYMLYCFLNEKIKFNKPKDKLLVILFILSFNMFVAVGWEFFEYFCLIVLKNDAINHYTTGVHDSITDMLVAFIGGLIIVYLVIHYFKTNKENISIKLTNKFYNTNKAKEKA